MPVATIVYRIQGKELVDLLYAATDKDVRGCKLLQVAMLALQLQLQPVSAAPPNSALLTMFEPKGMIRNAVFACCVHKYLYQEG